MKIKKIPDTELEIMQVVWNNPTPISTGEIKAALEEERPWSSGALQSLLSRLVERGFLKGEMRGKCKVFSPLVMENEYLAVESRSFLDKLHRNSITELVASLYNTKALSDKDIEELDAFLDEVRGEL